MSLLRHQFIPTLLFTLAGAAFFSLLPLSTSAATLYYNNDRGDGDWSNLENWWTNAGFTSEASTLPTASDDVIVSADLITNTGDPITVNSATFTGTAQNQILLTVTTLATFADQSINYQGEISGDALFSGTAINYGTTTSATFTNSSNNQGTTTATATFQDTTINAGYIGTDASFAGSSYNVGTVAGNAVFIGNDAFNDNVIIGNATFTGTAYSFDPTYSSGISGSITLPNDVVFTLTDENWTGSTDNWSLFGTLTLILNGSSTLDSAVSFRGNIIFNDTSYAEPGAVLWSGDVTLTGSAYTYDPLNDLAPMMSGTVTFTQPDVAFTLSGTSIWRSGTSGWVMSGTPTWEFNESSSNQSYVPSATFNDLSTNQGTVVGAATFTATTYARDPMGGSLADSVTFTQPNVAFSLSGDFTWSSDTSTWILSGTPTWEFNDTGNNAGIIAGDATFNDASYNAGTVTGAATFTSAAYTFDPMNSGTAGSVVFTQSNVTFVLAATSGWYTNTSTWTLPGTPIWEFNGESSNYSFIPNAIFNDTSANNGTISGDAAFNDGTSNNDTVTGTATFNENSIVSGNSNINNAIFTGTAYTSDPTGIDLGAVIGSVVFSNNVVFTITDSTWSADTSTWTFNGTSNWIFNGESCNTGTIVGEVAFNDTSGYQEGDSAPCSGGFIVGNVEFNDNSTNDGTITGNATFNDQSYNNHYNCGAKVDGDATFTGTAYDRDPAGGALLVTGTVTFTQPVVFTIASIPVFRLGNAWESDTTDWAFVGGANWIFYDGGSSIGVLKGDVDVYFPVLYPLGGTVTGILTYHGYPENSLYFKDSDYDGDWNDPLNWWTNPDATGEHVLPNDTSDVVILDTLSLNSSSTAPIATVHTAVFVDDTENYISIAAATSTFLGTVYNGGDVIGNAVFGNASYNEGSVSGTATFNDESVNGSSGDIYEAVFNDNSYNNGMVASSTFNGASFNVGTVTGAATFTGTTYTSNPVGDVSGSVTFTNPVTFTISDGGTWTSDTSTWIFGDTANWVFVSGTANDGTIPSATFNGDSSNSSLWGNGVVTGHAIFNGSSTNGGTVGSAAFHGTSYNGGPWGNGSVTDNATFNDTSYNANSIGGDATFTGTAYTSNPVGTVSGSVAFTNPVTFTISNSSWQTDTDTWDFQQGATWVFGTYGENYNILKGDAIFIGTPGVSNQGIITGDADVYFYPMASLEGTVNGTITYHPEPLYFNGTDGDWNNLDNWYTDIAFTTHPDAIANPAYDTVFLYASTTLPSNYANNLYIRANDVVVDGGGYTIGGNVSGNGVNDGDDGFDFTLQNVTVSGVVGSAGHSSVTNGGAGGDITLIDTTIVSSGYSISVGGGSSTGCGNGGAGGSIVSTNSTYTDAYSDPGSASTATCPRVGGRGIRPPAPVVPPSTPNPLGPRSRSVVTPPAPNTPGTNIPRNTLRTLELTLAKLLAPLKLQDLPFFTTPISPNQGVTVLPNPLAGLRSPGELKLENLAALPNFSQHFSANLMSLIALKPPSATSTPSLPTITPPSNPPPPAPRSIWSWLKNIF